DTETSYGKHYPFLKGKNIFIIDDDNTQLSLLNEILSNHGAIVQTEINSSNALHILEKKDFDLILTDIQMPITDGFELLKKIRKNTSSSLIPVVALSGRKDMNATDYTEKGFTAYHPKPIEKDKLLVLISNIFGDDKVHTENNRK